MEDKTLKNTMTGFWFVIGVMCFVALLPFIVPGFIILIQFLIGVIIFAVVGSIALWCMSRIGGGINNALSSDDEDTT